MTCSAAARFSAAQPEQRSALKVIAGLMNFDAASVERWPVRPGARVPI